MASGILGQSAPSATTDTTVYTVPASTLAVLSVSVTNRGASAATVRIALSASGTPTTAEFIEFNASVPPAGVIERTGIALQAGKNVVVHCSTADTAVSVYGLESAT